MLNFALITVGASILSGTKAGIEVNEIITPRDRKEAGIGARRAAIVAELDATPTHCDPLVSNKFARRIALRRSSIPTDRLTRQIGKRNSTERGEPASNGFS